MTRRFRTTVRSVGKLTDEEAAGLVETAEQVILNLSHWQNG